MLLSIQIHTFSPFCGAALCCSFLGGSLQTAISENTKSGNHFPELKLKDILLQISLGLKYIHNSGMVHLDIKPSQYGSLCSSQQIYFSLRYVRVGACVSTKHWRCCLLAKSVSFFCFPKKFKRLYLFLPWAQGTERQKTLSQTAKPKYENRSLTYCIVKWQHIGCIWNVLTTSAVYTLSNSALTKVNRNEWFWHSMWNSRKWCYHFFFQAYFFCSEATSLFRGWNVSEVSFTQNRYPQSLSCSEVVWGKEILIVLLQIHRKEGG